LKALIREVVPPTLLEVFGDPDEGLELREEFKTQLQRSLDAVQAGGETTDVAAKLGPTW
jgi:hypothetical protein